MSDLQQLFENNVRWAEAIKQEDPDFFAKLARQQTPRVPLDRLLRRAGAGQ